MSMYPANDNDQDSLYPTDDNYVRNPMRIDLDGGGKKITNVDELKLSGTGAITGVLTINGLAYPPILPTTKNNVWLYSKSVGQNIYSGYGASQNSVDWETVVYNSPIYPVSLTGYTWPSGTVLNTLWIAPLTGTYRISVVLNGTANQDGSFSCLIYVNGGSAAGGDMVWTRQSNIFNGLYQTLSSTATTTVTMNAGTYVMVVGGDADASGYSLNVSGTNVTGPNVLRISTFMIEYLG